MSDMLTASALMAHVRALADDIGPRPAGTPREALAHDYVRQALADLGIADVETLTFRAPDTWGYSLILPAAAALLGNFLPGRRGRFLGGLISLLATYTLWQAMGARRPVINEFVPDGPSATQIVRIPAREARRHTLVFIGHVDANKHRLTFTPAFKRMLVSSGALGLSAAALNGLIQLIRSVGPRRAFGFDYRLTLLALAGALALLIADEQGPWIDGANDNATAVACLLGLAGYFHANPLAHTEVWLAFTGAEEVGGLGMHALLDAYGDRLRDAYFLDFEMVGAGSLAYVTRHSGLSGFDAYTPDPESAALAAETARRHPELGVQGAPMTILEEVAVLRSRGYRGLCLVGVGDDGFLVNWHQTSDTSAQIVPETLERAARFAVAYAQAVDGR